MRCVVLIIIGIGILLGGGWYVSHHLLGGSGAATLVSQDAADASASTAASDPSTFTDSALGFSFAIPPGFHVQKTLDDSGEMVLVQSSDASHGFQVYITAFNDPGSSITKARIEQEAHLSVGSDSPLTVATVAQGLQFDSTADTPPTRQAWFVYDGYLYQAQVWASDATLLQTILSSWHFTS